jgi:hypothetical protein
VTLTGNNFSAWATVTSSSPLLHIDSYKRDSATQIEAQVSIVDSAQPGSVSLMVGNPNSGSAASTFSIVVAQSAPAPNAPAQSPDAVKPPTPLSGEPAPQTPSAPPSTDQPATPAAPEQLPEPSVLKVTPRKICQGFDIDMEITGKNFVQGTKVSFASEGIHEVGVSSYSATEITVHIKVAGDAVPGKTSLFVINPDDSEAEFPIEIALKGTFPPPTPAPSTTPTAPAADDPTYTQRFDAFHLGNPTEVFHVHGKVKGSLVLASGTLKYEEDGKTLVNVSLSEIKEVKTAMMGQFEVKLDSGKTIHFAAASLKGSDAKAIVDAIEKAMPNPPATE